MKKTFLSLSLALSLAAATLSFSLPSNAQNRDQRRAISEATQTVQTQVQGVAVAAAAAGSTAIYVPLMWRQNDVFVFCKYGDPYYGGWSALNPTTGTFTVVNYYTYIYLGGYIGAAYYAAVCPFGGPLPGTWTGYGYNIADPTGEYTPFYH